MRPGLLAALLLPILASHAYCGAAPLRADIVRTTHGVVHVKANDFRSLGFGLAYAYAQDNLCMFADALLTVRGERSMYFDPAQHATKSVNGEYGAALDFMDLSNEDSDFFFKAYLDRDALQAGYASGSNEVREYLDGYAAGYNRRLADLGGRFPIACAGARWVKPITPEDMYLVIAEKALHASGEVFANEILAASVDAGKKPGVPAASHPVAVQDKRELVSAQMGSNGLAVGKELSTDGRGLLLGNPHYPWTSTDRFYQAHLTVPGKYDAMGVILGGIPLVVIGFNKDLAWTHTVTTAAHFATVRLPLDPASASSTRYLMNGNGVDMVPRTVSIQRREKDGSLVTRSRTFYFTEVGVVIVKPEAGSGWTDREVTVLVDPNRNNTRLLEQWLGIGRASSVRALKHTLDTVVGLPWVNTIAADRHGDTLFADASVVPAVTASMFGAGCMINPVLLTFDGARAQCWWKNAIAAPDAGPWTIRSDYVANSNDSFWTTNAGARMGEGAAAYSPMYGKTGIAQKLRTRVSLVQIEERLAHTKKWAYSDLATLAFANRVHAAELILPAFLPYCAAQEDLTTACKALSQWDRRANSDSRGAVLFREFWNRAAATPGLWSRAFDATDPVHTPSGVAPEAMPDLAAALRSAQDKLVSLGIPLDAALGDYQQERRNGVTTRLHGAIGDIDGSYNSIHMQSALGKEGYGNVAWGTSYVQIVGFNATGPQAMGMLVYGQSVDPQSRYFADQIDVYARKSWPALPFHEAEVRSDPHYSRLRLQQ